VKNAVGGLDVEDHVGKFSVVQGARYDAAYAHGRQIIPHLQAKRHQQQRVNNTQHTRQQRGNSQD
jgi:hypothetical protein